MYVCVCTNVSIFMKAHEKNPHFCTSLTLYYGRKFVQWTENMNILGLYRSMYLFNNIIVCI